MTFQLHLGKELQDHNLRGLSLTEEDAGEGELQGGRHHLLRQGLKLEFDICLSGHWTGILFHVYTAGGQGLPSPRRRFLDRERKKQQVNIGNYYLIDRTNRKWQQRKNFCSVILSNLSIKGYMVTIAEPLKKKLKSGFSCFCHFEFSCEIMPYIPYQKGPCFRDLLWARA